MRTPLTIGRELSHGFANLPLLTRSPAPFATVHLDLIARSAAPARS